MGSRIECFMVERAELMQVDLRRFVFSSESTCPGRYGYHTADIVIEPQLPAPAEYSPGKPSWQFDGWPFEPKPSRDDPRWPVRCECGYEFQPGDQWQANARRLYRDPRSGSLFVRENLPAGAMFRSPWYEKTWGYKGPDGICLSVMLPDGVVWEIDGEARDGGKWTRDGVPPKVTARPSILTSRYHGWLTDGFLVEC